MTLSSSVAVHVHIIRNRSQNFLICFYIGEGETVYDALFDAYKANKAAGGSRADFLFAASQIPGIYVPSLYNVTYKEDGTMLPLHLQKRAYLRKSVNS